jgi:phenylpyruvate tautomerase PptA (4-oxalocrotonate tautomerase family)
MPIIDVTLVLARGVFAPPNTAHQLANALGLALKAPQGHVWVRLHELAADHYAENDLEVVDSELPVFVTVLHAHLPTPAVMPNEVAEIVAAIATCLGRPPERVHIEYAAGGAGRVAFGGKLVR